MAQGPYWLFHPGDWVKVKLFSIPGPWIPIPHDRAVKVVKLGRHGNHDPLRQRIGVRVGRKKKLIWLSALYCRPFGA